MSNFNALVGQGSQEFTQKLPLQDLIFDVVL